MKNPLVACGTSARWGFGEWGMTCDGKWRVSNSSTSFVWASQGFGCMNSLIEAVVGLDVWNFIERPTSPNMRPLQMPGWTIIHPAPGCHIPSVLEPCCDIWRLGIGTRSLDSQRPSEAPWTCWVGRAFFLLFLNQRFFFGFVCLVTLWFGNSTNTSLPFFWLQIWSIAALRLSLNMLQEAFDWRRAFCSDQEDTFVTHCGM